MPSSIHRVYRWAIAFVVAATSALATAQTPPTPAKTPTQPEYTLHTRVPITILDVIVTDSKGNPIHDLKPSDFTLLEDNQEMKPNSFEEHRSDPPPPNTHPPAMLAKPASTPNTFTNFAPPAREHPINILLFDALNTPAQDQMMVQKQMLDFVNKAAPGTRMAVFILSTTLTLLQSFTTDTTLLKAAITSKKHLPMPSPIEDPWRDRLDIANNTAMPPWQIVNLEGEKAATRAQYELSGLRQLARDLATLPGRKNLIWFNGAFPEQFPPFPNNEAFPPEPPEKLRPQSYDLEPELKSLTDQLARAHVAVYPIDAHGLEADLSPDAPAWAKKNIDYMNIVEHGTMDDVADQTGGKAFYNTNGLTEAVQQALDTGANYYTFTYTPTNQQLDAKFRSIKVKVDRPDLHLTYRNGYLAIDPDAPQPAAKLKTPPPPIPIPPITNMLRTGLEPSAVFFNAKLTATTVTVERPSNEYDLQPSYKLGLPYRHYVVEYTIDAHTLTFTPRDGTYYGDLEFSILAYDENGDVIQTISKEVQPSLSLQHAQAMLQSGAVALQEIDLPGKGDLFLHVAVRDVPSGRTGSIEIPTTSITAEK